MKVVVLVAVFFILGYSIGTINVKERVIYQTKTEYIKDPDNITKAAMDSEIAKTKENSYRAGYAEGQKAGIGEGYKSGYTQGIDYGQSIILDQIDLRVKEAEDTNQNIPLFRVKRD